MPVFDSNCFYIIQCLALVFVAAPCVLFAGGMLICLLLWCGLRITRAMHLRLLGLPRCGRCLHRRALRRKSRRPPGRGRRTEDLHGSYAWR